MSEHISLFRFVSVLAKGKNKSFILSVQHSQRHALFVLHVGKETMRIVKLDMYTHPCLQAACWHYWWWTDKVSKCHLRRRLRSDNISLSWRPPAQKTLQDKKRKIKSTRHNQQLFSRFCVCVGGLYGTWGADMGWNLHIRAETQEVAFIGLLILKGVRHWTHTADWEQRLVRYRSIRLGTWLDK